MKNNLQMKENFLTKKPTIDAFYTTLFLVLLLVYGSYVYLNDFFGADQWMPASGRSVYVNGEYWRAWTTLFAHHDIGHLLSNLFLFFPFAFLLNGYFGNLFFPLAGITAGGLINLVVLKTLPEDIWLIGISGVVYWMGASWMTLSFLIDRRESIGKNIIKVTGISAILFIPNTFYANVSYLSHFCGYFFGVMSGCIHYYLCRRKIRAADVFVEITEEAMDEEDIEQDSPSNDT